MAIKIKKKVDRAAADDPNAPDQILVATRDTFDWLNDHWKWALGGIAGLVVVIIVGSFSLEAWRDRHVESSIGFFEALAVMNAPPGEEGVPPNRAADVVARTESLLAEGVAAGDLVRVLRAGALLAQGSGAEALADLEHFAASARPEEALLARFAMAVAMAEAGDVNGALSTLDAVVAQRPGLAAAAAVQRAHILDASGDEEAALAAWESVLDDYPAAPGADFAEQRAQGLRIALDRHPDEEG